MQIQCAHLRLNVHCQLMLLQMLPLLPQALLPILTALLLTVPGQPQLLLQVLLLLLLLTLLPLPHLQHVALLHAAQPLLALLCCLKRHACDALHFALTVHICVESNALALVVGAKALRGERHSSSS
jgi:hypothetical protein